MQAAEEQLTKLGQELWQARRVQVGCPLVPYDSYRMVHTCKALAYAHKALALIVMGRVGRMGT